MTDRQIRPGDRVRLPGTVEVGTVRGLEHGIATVVWDVSGPALVYADHLLVVRAVVE